MLTRWTSLAQRTSTDLLPAEIMILNNKDPYRSSRIDLLATEFLDETKTGPSDFLFIDPYSIGDVLYSMALMESFRNKHNLHTVNINIICNPRCLPLKRFFPAVSAVYTAECAPLEYGFAVFASRYRLSPGVPVLLTPDMYAQGWLHRLICEGRISTIDAKRLILELDLSSELSAPQLSDSDRELAIANAREQGLEEDSVIIFNHANTLQSLPPDAYACLHELFPGKVFYDETPDGRGAIPNARPITMPLNAIPYFAEYAGNVVAVRSGIVDLLGMTKCSLVTIYPNLEMVHTGFTDRASVCKSAQRATLANYGIRRSCPEQVVQLNDGDTAATISAAIAVAVQECRRF